MASPLDERAIGWQRNAIYAAVVGSPLLVLPSANDPFGVPKFALVLAAAAVVLSSWVVRVVSSAELPVRRAPVVYAMAAFSVAVVVAWVAAPDTWLATVGAYGRWTGAAAYLSYVLIAVTIGAVFDLPAVATCVRAVAVAFGLVALLGLMQELGTGPLAWQSIYGDAVTASLGNPNFAGAYLGLGLPLVVWIMLTDRSSGVRLAAGSAGLLGIAAILSTRTLQGPISAIIGISALVVAWLSTRATRTARRVGLALLGFAGVAAVVAVPLLGGLSGIAVRGNLLFRTFYWTAAARMFREAPLVGVGMDHFSAYYRAFKPIEASEVLGVTATSDAAHNVPLMMFSSGGLLLGAAYLAVVATTVLLIVAAWRRADTYSQQLLVGAVTGAWLAYQAQSLISIDVPPLALLHWVLVGLLIVLSGAPRRSWHLPWEPAREMKRGGARRGVLGLSVALVVGLPVLWAAVGLVRADLLAGPALRGASTSVALERLDRSTDLVPWEATYWNARGTVLAESGRLPGAREAFEEGASRAPRNMESLVSAARVAVGLGDLEAALDWYSRAVQVAPRDPDILTEAAETALAAGRPERATELAMEALALDPDEERAQAVLERSVGSD